MAFTPPGARLDARRAEVVRPLARVALLAAWIGLFAGLVEVALRFAQKIAFHRFVYLGRQMVWMTPLAEVLLTLAVALLLLLAGRRWPRLTSAGTATAILVFPVALSVLLIQPWLHWWAVSILALGVATGAGRIAEAHEARLLRAMRLSLPLLALVPIVLAAVVNVRAARAERRELAAAPAAAGTPNVLFLIWDTVRADALSLYGYARPTSPNLTAFAARGAAFERAMSTASYTMTSHASFFTGLDPHRFTATWEVPLDTAAPTLAEALAAQGYRTAAFSANHIFVTWEHGLQRGFGRFDDYPVTCAELLRSSTLLRALADNHGLRTAIRRYDVPGRRTATAIQGKLLEWIDDGPTDRPFFAFLNLYDAHEPYFPPAPFDTMFGWSGGTDRSLMHEVRSQSLAGRLELDSVAKSRQRDRYDGAIAGLDRDLGLLLGELQRRGVLENTIVIISSDHGEAFGEHRTFSHGNDVYQNVVHVPLVIVYPPRVPAGARIAEVVSLRDIPATIAELAGLAPRPNAPAGRSLASHWDTTQRRRDTVLTEIDRLPRGGESWYPVVNGDVRSVIVQPWQLIMTGDSAELYDIVADPGQRANLAGDAQYRGTLDTLTALLRARRADAVPSKR